MAEGRGEGLSWPRLSSSLSPLPSPSRRSHQLELRDTTEAPIFSSATYPISWSKAKLVMIFKRGNRKDPNNYRGISIINSIAKLFDMVHCNRLELWFKPYKEQAGA